MIGHAVDGYQFMTVVLNDSGDVLVEAVFPGFRDEGDSVLYSEDGVYVDLGIGIGHD